MSILIYAESAEGKFKKVASITICKKKVAESLRNHGNGSSD
jgi:hypothetical protein